MALILKEGFVFTDDFGYTHSDFYAVIDEIYINKKEQIASFSVDIYKDEASRTSNFKPKKLSYSVNKSEFPNFIESINICGDAYKAVYTLISSRNEWVNWISDEVVIKEATVLESK